MADADDDDDDEPIVVDPEAVQEELDAMVVHYRQGGQFWRHLDYHSAHFLESKCLEDITSGYGDNVIYFYLSSEASAHLIASEGPTGPRAAYSSSPRASATEAEKSVTKAS